MDLVAGDAREILLSIGLDDWDALDDRRRFTAHLSLCGGLDPEWLDLFAEAARGALGGPEPGPFAASRHSLGGSPAALADRSVDRVDPHWIDAVALIPDGSVDRIGARWVELLDREGCQIGVDDKPALRELVGDLVGFCHRARNAEDVLFTWSI